MPPPSLPTMTWMRGSCSDGGSSRAPTSCSRARSPSTTRVTPGRPPDCEASAMPVAVATVPSIPARPRLACTGTFLPPSTSSATRTSRDEPNIRRSCGQVARHTASTRPARSSGARTAASSARIAPSRSCGTADESPSASGAGGLRSTDAARDACSHAPSHSRSGSPARHGDRVDGDRHPVEVDRLARAAYGEHLDLRVGKQRGRLAAERRVPEHDRHARCVRRAAGSRAAGGSRGRGCGRTAPR